jgi:hypothetical protein
MVMLYQIYKLKENLSYSVTQKIDRKKSKGKEEKQERSLPDVSKNSKKRQNLQITKL